MSELSRRDFLKKSAALAAMATAIPVTYAPKPVWAQAPSDRIRLGCIGVGSMGLGDAHGFNGLTDIVAICDVDENYGIARTINSGIGKRDANGQVIQPDTYKDYRRILERDDIDAVSIVTPDHWHVKIAVEALMAGKHVFCQKPLTLTLEENQIIRRACAKYGKAFQIGTWQRCQIDQFVKATLLVRKGYIGDVKKITCDIGGSPTSGEIPKAEVPAGLDWEMWQGPAPRHDFLSTGVTNNRDGNLGQTRCHYEFRWWYEYSGGKFTDWGAHHIDCALWALNLQTPGTGPISFDGTNAHHPVEFKDGYPTVDNRYNTSDNFDIKCMFENGIEMHVVSGSPDGNGILFEGTKGRFHVSRGRCKGKPVEELPQDAFTEDDYRELFHGKPVEGHKENFIRCVREGGTCISDVVSHVQAMNACHLCGIAARLNREIKWDPKAEKIVGDDQAATFYARQETKGYEIPRNF
ncbi:MAG: Gfo/Idh/MocA family oxidoreductase [Thermoguttaceae bacterium]|nr:Gfo/Idh/MocA family oxidoreductase [Thermoguttaceae bacterium]MDO4857772.1 Gfo/Idh/MocA family oxidoreductase [Thermoguttaceae bacterium]